MKEEKQDKINYPEVGEIEDELQRVRYDENFRYALRTTTYAVVTVAALALLIATLVLPVLQVYGNAMEPTVAEGSIVLATKTGAPKKGDVLAFYFNNKILIRRVIAGPGDTVFMDANGRVSVNSYALTEPYVQSIHPGLTDLAYPFQVPEASYFVMGDDRMHSIDSRTTAVGCVEEEDFVGVVRVCIWPLNKVGLIR